VTLRLRIIRLGLLTKGVIFVRCLGYLNLANRGHYVTSKVKGNHVVSHDVKIYVPGGEIDDLCSYYLAQ